MNELPDRIYPCGCTATGGVGLPTYCPKHGQPSQRPDLEAAARVCENEAKTVEGWSAYHLACENCAKAIRAIATGPAAQGPAERPQPVPTLYRCNQHGGYGFVRDCAVCKAERPHVARGEERRKATPGEDWTYGIATDGPLRRYARFDRRAGAKEQVERTPEITNTHRCGVCGAWGSLQSVKEHCKTQHPSITATPVLPSEYKPAPSITDAVMDVVDRLGSEWTDVDPKAWEHLRVYIPSPPAAAQGVEQGYERFADMPADVLATRVVQSLILQKGNLNRYALIIEHLIRLMRSELAPPGSPAGEHR